MSRSYRHTPVVKLCGHSNKDWRTQYNRRMRHHNKVLTAKGQPEASRRHSWQFQSEDEICPCCECSNTANHESRQTSWDDTNWMDKHEAGDIWTSNSDGWVAYWNFDSEREKRSPRLTGPFWDEYDRKLRYRLQRK